MLSNANTIAIRCQIYQVKIKESKQPEKKIRKIYGQRKKWRQAKKGQKRLLEMPLASPGI